MKKIDRGTPSPSFALRGLGPTPPLPLSTSGFGNLQARAPLSNSSSVSSTAAEVNGMHGSASREVLDMYTPSEYNPVHGSQSDYNNPSGSSPSSGDTAVYAGLSSSYTGGSTSVNSQAPTRRSSPPLTGNAVLSPRGLTQRKGDMLGVKTLAPDAVMPEDNMIYAISLPVQSGRQLKDDCIMDDVDELLMESIAQEI